MIGTSVMKDLSCWIFHFSHFSCLFLTSSFIYVFLGMEEGKRQRDMDHVFGGKVRGEKLFQNKSRLCFFIKMF